MAWGALLPPTPVAILLGAWRTHLGLLGFVSTTACVFPGETLLMLWNLT